MELLFVIFVLCCAGLRIYCLSICTDPTLLKSVRNGEKLEGYLIEATSTSLMNCGKECVVTDPCRDVTCLDNEKCVVKNDTGVCIKYDCNIPKEMAYSRKPKYSGTVIGYHAVYSCYGPGVVRENVTLTCDQNGQWVGEQCRKISTCLQIKQCDNNNYYTDGEYWIYPLKYNNTERVKIYCDGLNTTSPKEYITLINENILKPGNIKVWTNGKYCCMIEYNGPRPGEVKFYKIRVNPHSMLVDVSDTTFTSESVGNQSYALIDTSYTGLIVSRKVESDSSKKSIQRILYSKNWLHWCRKRVFFYLVPDASANIPTDSANEVNC